MDLISFKAGGSIENLFKVLSFKLAFNRVNLYLIQRLGQKKNKNIII